MTDRFSRPQGKALREYLAALGRKGGKARAKELTPKRRRAIARMAARTRWQGKRKGEP